MKDKVLMVMLDSAFKSVSNFEKESEIQDAFFYILDKANVLLLISIARIEMNQPMTDKKKKKEHKMFDLCLKIEKEALKKKDIILKGEKSSPLLSIFIERLDVVKGLLK